MTEQLELIRESRRHLDMARAKLADPTLEHFESCAVDVSRAVEFLHRLESMPKPMTASSLGREQEMRMELEGLRRDMRQVNELMSGAGKFLEGWARLIVNTDGAASNYSADGRTHESQPAGRLVVHG